MIGVNAAHLERPYLGLWMRFSTIHALNLIAKASILFEGLLPSGQRELLRLMVERVVISPKGQVVRVELKPPFGYLSRLMANTTDATNSKGVATGARNKEDVVVATSKTGSISKNSSAPTGAPTQTLLQFFS